MNECCTCIYFKFYKLVKNRPFACIAFYIALVFQNCLEMERYLKNEPRLTSYRKLDTDADSNSWTKFISMPSSSSSRTSESFRAVGVTDSSSSSTVFPFRLHHGPELDESPISPTPYTKRDDGSNPVENLAWLNMNDTLQSSSSSGSSSAVSWDSDRSDPVLPRFKRPFAVRLVSRPGRRTTMPCAYSAGPTSPDDIPVKAPSRFQALHGLFQSGRASAAREPMAVPTGGNKADEGPVYGGNEEQTVIDSKKRVYKCSYEECEKIYTKSSHLKAHLRSHTGRYNRLFVYLFGCLSSVLSVSLLVRLSINLAILMSSISLSISRYPGLCLSV